VPGDRPDTHGAVPAQDDRDLLSADRVSNPPGSVLDDLHDRGDILSVGMLAIRSPAPHFAVSAIAEIDSEPSQHRDQPGIAQCTRAVLLAGRERRRTGRHADDAEPTTQKLCLIKSPILIQPSPPVHRARPTRPHHRVR
jgi:hypothetical protein